MTVGEHPMIKGKIKNTRILVFTFPPEMIECGMN
jgi:hypothetical protein